MRQIRPILVLIVAGLVLWCRFVPAEETQPGVEFNTALMRSTFRLQGQGSQGTAFLAGRPHPQVPTKLRYVLVTAAHVLENMQGDVAILVLRQEVAPAIWESLPIGVKIREKDRTLWTKHPQADIAVMYIAVPERATVALVPIDMLADDNLLTRYEIHPGDELNCLGYPFGTGSIQGDFPVLRSGKIASYPLLPSKEVKTFLLDFPVFPGNSGGPVYISYSGERIVGNAIRIGTTFQFVMGLVSQQRLVTQRIEELYGTREQRYSLGLAEIVHASLIRETIELLPLPEDAPD
jgi:S1-C subfamily serine protease